jgi:hypothetical protein
MTDKRTFESEGIEPVYDLERGEELNERAGEHDPAFKKKMEQGRAEAGIAKRTGRQRD